MSDAKPETPDDRRPQETSVLVAVLQRGWKLLLGGAIVLAILLVVYLTPLRDMLAHADALRKLGWIAPAAFVALTSVLVAGGFSRLIMCAASGLAFGFWPGLLLANLGALTGSYATFLFARWGGGDFLLRKWPRLRKYERMLSGGGMWMVMLAKQIPMNGLITNTVLGLSRVRHRDFLLGTAIGIFPQAVPATLAGASIVQGTLARSALYISLAIVLFALAALVLRSLARRARAVPPAAKARGPDTPPVNENK